MNKQPVFRFAPSPNGRLHLGHAYSALLNKRMAEQMSGRLLLRIEDIDTARCTPELEQGIYEDLKWLGISWEQAVRRQSEHFSEYQAALNSLADLGVIYPAFLSRGEVRAFMANSISNHTEWPSDPDGSLHYPTIERDLSEQERKEKIASGIPYAWRLNMEKALQLTTDELFWTETGHGHNGESGSILANPAQWGDVILARKDTPTSYHLSVVLDDALQGITHVVRGRDLFYATSIHRLLQTLLKLPAPAYHHHDLVLADDGHKLSKSMNDTALTSLREQGWSRADIYAKLGI